MNLCKCHSKRRICILNEFSLLKNSWKNLLTSVVQLIFIFLNYFTLSKTIKPLTLLLRD